MPKSRVVTFGCRLNHYESALIEKHLKSIDSALETVVFNTCAVTAEAERQAKQAIRSLKRDNPETRIVVTGCGAQLNAKMFEVMPEVSTVLGNREKMEAAFLAKPQGTFVGEMEKVSALPAHTPLPSAELDQKKRVFLQIQNGCDHACTFCVITKARGPSQSIAKEKLVAQINALVATGVEEVVLTGVDLTAYGQDFEVPLTLTDLVRFLLLKVPQLKRLRISSLDPAEIDASFFQLVAKEKRLMPHFHISLQAGADLILKRMKRRHLRQDVITFCQRLRHVRPDAVLGADIIVGFPTETEAHFQDTLDLVEECRIALLHVFPFSPRPETPAARMPQVPKAVAKERSQRLRRLGDKVYYDTLESFVGQTCSVLLERAQRGYNAHFLPVVVETSPATRGVLENVLIEGIVEKEGKKHLLGRPLEVRHVA